MINILNDESKLDIELPILGQGKYLQTKSKEFGWFVSEDYVLAFFLEKRLIFKRMVFTTGAVAKKSNLTAASEKAFLNNVVDHVKQYNICDFIYKAQSNAIFNACPKESDCVPWGTYEVDLNRSDEELFSAFNGKCRNVIRKAIKEGVTVQETKEVELIFQNIKETLERQNSIHFPSYDYIAKLQQNIKDNIIFLIATKENVVQGSLILIYDDHAGYAMYAGSIKSPQTGSLDLMHYEAMKYLQQKNVKIYDFVGARINVKKGSKYEKIQRFKLKFDVHLREGFAFRTIINPKKFYLFNMISTLYLKLKGYAYVDPIEQIKDENY
jgi:hypothetical protein